MMRLQFVSTQTYSQGCNWFWRCTCFRYGHTLRKFENNRFLY